MSWQSVNFVLFFEALFCFQFHSHRSQRTFLARAKSTNYETLRACPAAGRASWRLSSARWPTRHGAARLQFTAGFSATRGVDYEQNMGRITLNYVFPEEAQWHHGDGNELKFLSHQPPVSDSNVEISLAIPRDDDRCCTTSYNI